MSTFYNGISGNETWHTSKNIQSSTNASPIEITTTAAHGFLTGDVVQVINHSTNYNANGIWPIVVVDSTRFTLTGTTATGGAGGATGSCILQNLTPQFQLPSDGDDLTAASVNNGLEDAGDRGAWSALRTGAYRIASTAKTTLNNDTSFASFASGSVDNTAFIVALGTVAGMPAVEVITPSAALDVVKATMTFTAQAATHRVAFTIGYEAYNYGSSPTGLVANINYVLGQWQLIDTGVRMPVTLNMHLVVPFTAAGKGENIQLYLIALGDNAAAGTYDLYGDCSLSTTVLRVNT